MLPVANQPYNVQRQHQTQIRVRYQETDGQGHVHNSNYLNYFEIGRVEMLRTSGFGYREFEDSGLMLVIVNINCDYYLPAKFDDLLTITTTVVKAKGVRIFHQYEITRDDEMLVQGTSIVACVDRAGKPKPLPKWLRFESIEA